MPSPHPTTHLSHLPKTDGSATYTTPTHSIITSIHGPIEQSRRDELPSSATIDVTIRPASGVGSVRERWLESIIANTLRSVVDVGQFPRCAILVTCQVVKGFGGGGGGGGVLDLALLPPLLQSCTLALLSSSLPLTTTISSTLLAIIPQSTSQILSNPTIQQLQAATSIHVLAFTATGELVVCESQGEFMREKWEEVYEVAKRICCDGEGERDVDVDGMQGIEDDTMQGNITQLYKTVMQEKLAADLYWKN